MQQIIITTRLIALSAMLTAPVTAIADSVIGTWKAIDPNDGSTAYVAFTFPESDLLDVREYRSTTAVGAFVDSEARQACGDGTQAGVPFIGTIQTDLQAKETTLYENYQFQVELTGTCQKKRDEVSLQLNPWYIGETDTLLFLGTEWHRFEFDPQKFINGVEELQGSGGWLVADLILDAHERHHHNAICRINRDISFLAGQVRSELSTEINRIRGWHFGDFFYSPSIGSFGGAIQGLRSELHETSCHDGIDNDCDGLVDNQDSDCQD